MLNFPAISIRQSMERPEAQDYGKIILSGLNINVVLDSIDCAIECSKTMSFIGADIPDTYRIYNTSERVIKLILGLSKLSNVWDNIYPKELK